MKERSVDSTWRRFLRCVTVCLIDAQKLRSLEQSRKKWQRKRRIRRKERSVSLSKKAERSKPIIIAKDRSVEASPPLNLTIKRLESEHSWSVPALTGLITSHYLWWKHSLPPLLNHTDDDGWRIASPIAPICRSTFTPDSASFMVDMNGG